MRALSSGAIAARPRGLGHLQARDELRGVLAAFMGRRVPLAAVECKSDLTRKAADATAKRKYPMRKHDEDRTTFNDTNRAQVQVPEQLRDRLLEIALELGFLNAGKAAIVPLIEAVSRLEPEDLGMLLEDNDLLPRPSAENCQRRLPVD